MARCLFDAKLLTVPMITKCQLNLKKQTPVKLEWKCNIFQSRKAFENIVCNVLAIYILLIVLTLVLLKPQYITLLVVNYDISHTTVLEIP